MYSPTKKSVTPRIFAALIGLTVTASLAACSNNDKDDNNPELGKTTDASVSESTEFVPASEDGPAQNVPEPRLPAVATENTEEGAEATLEYFWEAIDYGRLTGDTDKAKIVSADNCDLCSDLILGWQDVYTKDSWAALHGEMQLEVGDTSLFETEDSDQTIAEIDFKMTEPAVDFYENGVFLEDESFSTESTAPWWTQLVFDATSQRWEIEWIGLEEHLPKE